MNQKPTGITKIHLCIHVSDVKNSSADGTPLMQSSGNKIVLLSIISRIVVYVDIRWTQIYDCQHEINFVAI